MKIELCSPAEIERYRVVHRPEILRILRGIMASKALVTAYGDRDGDFLVTTIIGLAPDEKTFYLGASEDERRDKGLVSSREVSFNTAHDQVRVLFTTPAIAAVDLEGERVLRARVPSELFRFQRREFYRIPTSLVNPVRCLIDTDGGVLEATVVDISIGGLGMLIHPEEVAINAGETYAGCRVSLPDAGNFIVSLRICTLHQVTLRNGAPARRAGCKFVDLAPSLETEVQRYIIRLERERRAHSL